MTREVTATNTGPTLGRHKTLTHTHTLERSLACSAVACMYDVAHTLAHTHTYKNGHHYHGYNAHASSNAHHYMTRLDRTRQDMTI